MTLFALFAGRAGLSEFVDHFRDPAVVAVSEKMRMQLYPELDSADPGRWLGKVTVENVDGIRSDAPARYWAGASSRSRRIRSRAKIGKRSKLRMQMYSCRKAHSSLRPTMLMSMVCR